MKLFVCTDLNDVRKTVLNEALPDSITVTYKNELSESDALTAFQQAELLLGNPPLAWFKTPPQALAFWQLDSAGFDQYRDLNLSAVIVNMGDYFAVPCAETIVAGILAFYRGMPRLVKAQYEHRWIGKKIRPTLDLLSTKSVIVLGAGAIGLHVKKMVSGFTADVKVSARTNPQADIHSTDELMRLLPQTDLVINALPGTADKFVSAAFLAAMKTGSVYASVGRGNTTDEAALIAELESGRLGGAVLDVTAVEPLPGNSRLWDLENVVLTQHSAGGQTGEDEGKVQHLISNLKTFLDGGQCADQVQLSKGY